ncbi:PE domain-containing protein [Actinoplanes sp. NPDC051851]|uniref:PE domain-containing protein n=1 Tax=Actinoplanes sp. NPDC051851 TaxID=3154753 RepID=UPI003424C04B
MTDGAGGVVHVDPDSLAQSGQLLGQAADRLSDLSDRYRAALSDYAEACGGDDIGMLLATTGEACAGMFFDLLDATAADLQDDADDLTTMATAYAGNEETNTGLMTDLSRRLVV